MEYEQLRPHQKTAVSLLRSEWKQNRTHMVYAPVGAGKTAIASYITGSFAERGMRVLFIAPYTILITQTVERFNQYGLPPVGVIWQSVDPQPHRMIQVASAQTLERREWPHNIDLVIVDEAHIRRKELLKIFASIDTPIIGLSGTPFSPWLGEYYESLIKPCSMRQLINDGYLSDYEFFAPTTPNLKGVPVRPTAYGLDYAETAVAEVMGDATLVGDIVENWIDNGKNLPTVAFCCNVSHANITANEFERCGIPADVMTAKTPQEERQRIIARFEQGVIKVICNVGVLVAGFDSDVRCIIYARPTKSEMRWIQCLGRGLRAADGKDTCLIFDHSGSVHRLGFPDHIEYDDLPRKDDGMSESQKLVKEREKKEKLPKECPKCKYMKPAGVFQCPKCGMKPRAGEDVEVDRSRKLESLSGNDVKWTPEDKQKLYSELVGYQKERANAGKPISDGWVSHKYKEKTGVWPKGLHRSPRVPSPETRRWIQHQNIKFAKSRKADKANIGSLKELFNADS